MALQLPAQALHSLGDAQTNFEALARLLEIPQVAALPANPFNGQTIDYLADAANGVVWRLRYRAASSSNFKWEFVGGGTLRDADAPGQTTASSTYQTTGTSSVTAPLAGDYDCTWGCTLAWNQAAALNQMELGLHVNGVLAGGNPLQVLAASQFDGSPMAGRDRITGVLAGQPFNPRYRSQTALSANFRGFYVEITPVRVG